MSERKMWQVLSTAAVLVGTAGGPVAAAPVRPVANTGAQFPLPRPTERHRLILLTDIEVEPDDTQTLLHLLLYSNAIDIRGLIATTSGYLRDNVYPASITEAVAAYGAVQPNLARHEAGFPAAADLRGVVAAGPALYGMLGVGEGHDSTGSERIVAELASSDPRPLFVAIGGGPNVLAQALWKIRKTYPAAVARQMIAKLRVIASGDQDDSGLWIRREFPDLSYRIKVDGRPKEAKPAAPLFADYVSPEWIARNIQQGHGAYAALYPDTAFLNEDDSPCFLALIPNGLNDPEHPALGGWGGRFVANPNAATAGTPKWIPGIDTFVDEDGLRSFLRPEPTGARYTGLRVALDRWRPAVQNDFAARVAWTTRAPSEVNHPPVARVVGASTRTVRAGENFELDASPSFDADGDSLTYQWINYEEESGASKVFDFWPLPQNMKHMRLTAPKVAQPAAIHFILKVTDKGTPALTRYQRVTVNVLPAK